VYACDRFISDNVTLGEHIVFERFLPGSHVTHGPGAAAMAGLHDHERSHYNRVWTLGNEIATSRLRRGSQ
jgi:hypothetical protein